MRSCVHRVDKFSFRITYHQNNTSNERVSSCGERAADEQAERKQRDMRREKKGCGEQSDSSRLRFWDRNSEAATIPLLSWRTPQVASQDMLMLMSSLTADEAVDSAAFPIPRREVGIWGCCISATTGRLSEDHSTSPASPPTGPAARGHPPLRTAQTRRPRSSHILHYLIYSAQQVYLYIL